MSSPVRFERWAFIRDGSINYCTVLFDDKGMAQFSAELVNSMFTELGGSLNMKGPL